MRRFFRRGRLDAERAREMQAHLDHHVDDLVAAGHARDRADSRSAPPVRQSAPRSARRSTR